MRGQPRASVTAAEKPRWYSASIFLAAGIGLTLAISACVLEGAGGAPNASEDELTVDFASAQLSRAADGGDLYGGLENLHDQALKDALFAIVKNQTPLGYNRARAVMFKPPLLVPGAPLECVYTGRIVEPDGTSTPHGFNTEHSWPQSLGASTEPARSDLHHLFPVDDHANSERGSFPFGNVTCLESDAGACPFESGGSALGRTEKGAAAFEVRSKTRGDIARAQFYFAVRYRKSIPADVETTLRAWHEQDPVDEGERTRNDNIDRAQHNRNPFVDRPEFVRQIADF